MGNEYSSQKPKLRYLKIYSVDMILEFDYDFNLFGI